jgi:hypothetical protein
MGDFYVKCHLIKQPRLSNNFYFNKFNFKSYWFLLFHLPPFHLRVEVWRQRTSLTLPLFIEVPVPIKKLICHVYVCWGIHFVSFYSFSDWIRKVLQQCGIFLFFYIFSDWIRKVIQQCGIFCFSTFFLFGLGRCSNSVVFFCVSTFFLIGLGRCSNSVVIFVFLHFF